MMIAPLMDEEEHDTGCAKRMLDPFAEIRKLTTLLDAAEIVGNFMSQTLKGES